MIINITELSADAKEHLHWTMEVIKNNLIGVFVLLILMLPTSQSLPHGKETSSKRNSLTEALDFKIQKCLFVDRKLPICDPRWWSNSSEKSINNPGKGDPEKYIGKENKPPRRSNIELSSDTRIVVHAFNNCLPTEPDKLRGLMPFCEDVLRSHPLDKIVRIEIFDPFVVDGLTKPPYFFPGRPKHDATNRKHRVSVPEETAITEPPHGRTDELMKAATTKETIPNVIAANMNISNGSSSNRLIPSNRPKPAKSTDKEGKTIVDTFSSDAEQKELNKSRKSIEKMDDVDSPTTSRVPIVATSRRTIVHERRNKMELRRKKPRGYSGLKFLGEMHRRWKMVVADRKKLNRYGKKENLDAIPAIPAIPTIPVTSSPSDAPKYTGKFLLENSSAKMNYDNSKNFLKPSVQREHDTIGIADDLNDLSTMSEAITKDLRRKREIRLPSEGFGQTIPGEAKVQGIVSKSVQRQQEAGKVSNANELVTPDELKKYSLSLKIDEQGIAGSEIDSTMTTAVHSPKKLIETSQFDVLSSVERSKDEVYSSVSSQKILEENLLKGKKSRKKYRSFDLFSFRGH
ncbi:hypothetical protein WN55_09303 [Dufourea novaeangliae]|uniref:Uncharacterized protein n=1 Tax=Dufourea novaeangliae TaxID=178035 RepID=A0A154P914_DUFNO|nr:hypothetical protein WN55_09303 [Dufourea novaeangliae]